jgi:hypothetical protein
MIMNRSPIIGSLFIALALFSSVSRSQVTVQGGNPVLSITTGTAGLAPTPVVSSTASLRYRRQPVVTKITVSTSCPGQRFSLSVLAVAPTAGIAAPSVVLANGMLPIDFLVSIPSGGGGNQRCTLQYTASSTFAQGNSSELGGNDVHTVTYTLVAQ